MIHSIPIRAVVIKLHTIAWTHIGESAAFFGAEERDLGDRMDRLLRARAVAIVLVEPALPS